MSKLQEFTAPTPVPQKPWAAGLGIFRSKEPHPIPKVALKNMVFVTIALTQLNASNGWYTLLEASHLQLPPVPESEWRKVDKELAPGDVIIWRGDLAVLESAGGGGKFINLTYDVQRE
jgi:hypothetical protein